MLASRSEATLLFLTLFAAACLLTLAALEVVRSRMLVRLGASFDAGSRARCSVTPCPPDTMGRRCAMSTPLRGFLTSAQILSLLDAPWIPVHVALVYLLHPMLGHVALFGALVLFALGLWNERSTRAPLSEAASELAASTRFAELSARNAEAVRAMGMLPGLAAIWRKRHDLGMGLQGVASDRGANVAAIAKATRFMLQIAILGIGAWLVIQEQTTAGVMIAASIIMGRGLAPVEAAIGGWRGFLHARQAHQRLSAEFGVRAQDEQAMPLRHLPGTRIRGSQVDRPTHGG